MTGAERRLHGALRDLLPECVDMLLDFGERLKASEPGIAAGFHCA
jgi:hypothetical protein